ncbi:hypothetical protein DOTSEDRAFT_84767 [Dothistroma septosporum NZE10]|uniref:PNPLA domain-containing protein n=1 Tax=Dothistroma septosporum (strain NZE10 / CBS 128990) TaxID=675120 RepID=N1Q476_DOTSN|nr:hypothetical protein DOTSEDRAFT_84767 [Dothistroma septosporum NZE10]
MAPAPVRRHGLLSILFAVTDIVYTWIERSYNFVFSKSEEDRLIDGLLNASKYGEWWDAAVALDRRPESYNWRVNPIDDLYDYRHLDERRKELHRLRREEKPIAVANYLRHGLLRNLFNITKLPLYAKTYAGTKESIEAYVEESVRAIRYIAASPTALHTGEGRLTAQEKLDVLHESNRTFGSTALLLQGGSIFGLCHLGVVKALLEHNILPRVIVGTATGALMASLIGIHTLEELPAFLSGDGIDLSAFANSSMKAQEETDEKLEVRETAPPTTKFHNWYHTLERRAWRLVEQGFLLDPEVLSKCVKANVGDLTFEEAYRRTGCVLNIIISSPSEEIPNLMNYLTAPNYLVRSAALASHVSNMARSKESPIKLMFKDGNGVVRTLNVCSHNAESGKTRRPPSANDRKTPLTRLKQQFNIDHFIISQARPYVAPFVKPSLPYIRQQRSWLKASSQGPSNFLSFDAAEGIKHIMLLADIIGVLPDSLRRILSDETVKGDSLTVVPEVRLRDWKRLLKNPTKAEVDFWIMRGERSVWPSLCALKVRCLIEVALFREYEKVRRRRSYDTVPLALSRLQAALTPPTPRAPSLMLNSHPWPGPWGNEDDSDNVLNNRKRRAPNDSNGSERNGPESSDVVDQMLSGFCSIEPA